MQPVLIGIGAYLVVQFALGMLVSRRIASESDYVNAGRRLGVLEWRGYLAFFRRPRLAALLLQFFLFSVAFSVFITGFALFAKQRFTWDGHPFRAREVGYVYAYAGFLGIIIQGGLLRQLSKRYGDAPLVVAGFACSVVGYLLLGVVESLAAGLVSSAYKDAVAFVVLVVVCLAQVLGALPWRVVVEET